MKEDALSDKRETLSDVSHEIWSSWMRWMFTVGTVNEDGTWTMPASLVQRWQRQMETPYTELTEREKDSDREQADKILNAEATFEANQPALISATWDEAQKRWTHAVVSDGSVIP